MIRDSFQKIQLIIGLFLFILHCANAQFGNESSEDDSYKSEFVLGVNFNTNGGLIGGGMFKYSQKLEKKEQHFQSFALEIVNIKHPKEQLSVSPFTGISFVYGKRNYLFIVRPQYGREFVLFKKAREQGIQVNFIGAGGICLGLAAPYMIRYDDPNDPNDNLQDYVQFDPKKHKDPDFIRDTGGPFKGLSNAQINPGLNLKASLSFEFGVIKSSVSGFEAGLNLDFFTKKIIMFDIVKPEGRSYYSSIFLTFFFGGRN
ncbi:MAG: hypothetical protein OHK0038_22010 [Flammeovirgaceae bacterium]